MSLEFDHSNSNQYFDTFVSVLTRSMEQLDVFFPSDGFTGNLYKCHVWKVMKEMEVADKTDSALMKLIVNKLICLKDAQEWSSVTSPFFFRVIRKENSRFNFVLIDNEEGREYLVMTVVPSSCELWSAKTRDYRFSKIIEKMEQCYKMFYYQPGMEARSRRRYDEAEVEVGEEGGQEEGHDSDSDEEYEIDDCEVLSGKYGWPAGKYSMV